MFFLAGVAVALRLYTRGIILRVLGWEDWCICLALVFSGGNTIGMCLQATTALGRHIWTLTKEEMSFFLKEVYFTILVYNLGLAFVKLSILLLYIRLFAAVYLQRTIYIVLGTVAIVSTWAIGSSAFFCIPVAAFWDPQVTGTCLRKEPRWYAGAALNIFTDIIILALPLFIFRSLRMHMRQKIGLYFVFALGFFVCIVSMLRFSSLVVAAKTTDPTGDNPGVAKWSTIEINTAIICACLVTLKPLISRFFPKLLGSDHPGGDDGRHGNTDVRSPPPTVGGGSNWRLRRTSVSNYPTLVGTSSTDGTLHD
ncbi:hypothetical protein B0T26DRAFT_864637 [Lasiosphaeria miniovina]|uniref:Rhodopsin domain-containing protein n=1 Tax=Lasiosphaeria miniovina TaxID=1954250 RepID=A0AA39ZU22_9PEZI|nr:uncharacterized protein B0T26DRAFT_864637 [Lasiosphaeria miniovina]KAK0703682.1 hypothetical protein B0T26DRAFT_864637 [Lasiosphaeria miniovina]